MTKIRVQLTNRWAHIFCDPETQIELKAYFRYRPPNFEFTYGYQNGGDGYKDLLKGGRVATGLFLEQRDAIAEYYKLTVVDDRVSPQFQDGLDASLRPYQKDALAEMIKASKTGGLVLSATGSGKTLLAATFFRKLVGSGVFIVDELTLLEQSRIEIKKALNQKVGVVGKSEFTPQRITVATIQTLHKHRNRAEFRKWFSSLTAVIIDEIHLALNRRNLDVITSVRPLAVYGLTATLEIEKPHIRLPAIALAGPPIFSYPISQGVEEGYLSKGVVCLLEFEDPLTGKCPGYKAANGEFVQPWARAAQYRYHVCLNKARNNCVEKVVREGLKQGRKVIVLVEQKVHLRILSKRFDDVPHATLCGDVAAEERSKAVKQMDAGKLNLILASRVFTKGIDIRQVTMIVDATGQPSRNSAIQRYGRGVRTAKGKKGLVYVDIADRGSRFAGASHSRAAALRELGIPVITVRWNGNPKSVFTEL